MGSSKKHKDKDREHKKKRKHRSRSRSREKESKRRHRDREEEYGGAGYPHDPYVQDREEGEIEEQFASRESRDAPPPSSSKSGGEVTLSIDETNKLRAKLGLKPLEVASGSSNKPEKESLKDDVHKPAENWGEKQKQEKLKEKMERSKMRRQAADKLNKIKTLGESDSDEDAATWVRKNRMKQRERDRAEKTARMLEEMDEEFGIGNLVEEEFKDTKKKKNYTSRDLRGLKVDHDVGKFKEGQTVILTLKDRGILDEDEEGETLMNMNIADLERAEKNVELKKGKPDYNPYDDGDEDEYGLFKQKEVLSKYDEEIEGEKRKNFKLGSGGGYDDTEDRQMERITQHLRAQAQSLSSNINLASEYMTAAEVQAKFKKVNKKVRKIRKKKILKADDLLPLADEPVPGDLGSRSRMREEVAEIPGLDVKPDISTLIKQEPASDDDGAVMEYDDVEVEDLTGVKVEEDQAETDLQFALDKARKLKQKKEKKKPEKIAERIQAQINEEDEDMGEKDSNIILNATSEFCRALGEIPTYGQSGNRDEIEKDELVELERELLEQRRKMEEEDDEPTGWNRVEIDETPVNITGDEKAILEEEPVIATGMAGALAVAMNKGFLEHEKIKNFKPIKNKEEIEAQNYSIEDKRYDDLDEKYKKRDRFSGALMEFKEKAAYKPNFKLEYVDQNGRHLDAKEAFRQLSHRFHGKGSGKKKTEKRTKKLDEEFLMEKMSSTDTPLNTVALLKEKQTQEKTPYIVLSGNKGFTNTMVKSNT